MPPEILNYAQPHPRPEAAPKRRSRQIPLRRKPWFMATSRAVALLAIAAPVGALTWPIFGHEYGFAGAAVFVVTGATLLQIVPSRRSRWRILVGSAIAAAGIVAALHLLSIQKIVFENASGQPIRYISFHPANGDNSVGLYNVPTGAIVPVRVHKLFFNGRGGIGGGELADGTQLESRPVQKRWRYRGVVKIRVNPDGGVDASWP